jgi:thiamine biosynthesis lipoprotein
MKAALSRRKFLTITAAAAGLGLVPFRASRTSAAARLIEWRGLSLGSVATIRLHHPDESVARRLIEKAVAEAQWLETVFSLYRDDSSLSELNRRGVLIAPPSELIAVLTLCDRVWRITHGAFDPSVQPLWQGYVDHFTKSGAASPGPSEAKITDMLKLVGWEKVHFDRDKVMFDSPGMGLTLNGIAQGYITDRVVENLRQGGVDSFLADMGEIRGSGDQQDGRPWTVALEGPTGEVDAATLIPIVNKSVATSGAVGFRFNEEGRCNHLFNPSTGACADPSRNITVVTDDAVMADALSTAFALMEEDHIKLALQILGRTEVYITTEDRTRAVQAT